MAVIIKNLGSGTLTNTTAKVTGPGSGKSWLIKSLIVTNRDTVIRTVDIKVTGTSPSAVAYAAPPAMALAASSTAIIDTEITLQNPSGGTQETLSVGVGSTPTTGVDYVLNGIERDLV